MTNFVRLYIGEVSASETTSDLHNDNLIVAGVSARAPPIPSFTSHHPLVRRHRAVERSQSSSELTVRGMTTTKVMMIVMLTRIQRRTRTGMKTNLMVAVWTWMTSRCVPLGCTGSYSSVLPYRNKKRCL